MFILKNFLINVLDIISPQLSSKLRVIKANLNGEIKSFLILKDLSRKSKNIIDIGARVGFFTFMFRSLNPRLNHNYHLFEPFPPNLLIPIARAWCASSESAPRDIELIVNLL